ncbi:MAG: MoaD/ThiS family protein [Planctomycetaceae bacterium]|nr:MoaD/ThiS family protein [Planctomycetaceae bacterium]
MPRVFIPKLLTPLTGGVEEVDVAGTTIRQVLADLEARYPGLRDRLCDGDRLRSGLAVAIDGNVASLGLLAKVSPTSEVHFLPAIGGG